MSEGSVESFGSWEEMQRVMGEREDQANAGLNATQIELRDDVENTRYWIRPFPPENCYIFGVAWSFKESCDVSASYCSNVPTDTATLPERDEYNMSVSEAVYEIRSYAESRQRGYMRGIAYSILEPDGEYGSTHVSNVMPISEKAFEEGKAAGWKAVQVDAFLLDLIGEEAARKANWTPTLIAEINAFKDLI